MSVSTKKLVALRDFFLEGGSQETEDVLKQLGTDDESVLDEYIAELAKKWPKQFDQNYVEPDAHVQEDVEYSFWLLEGSIMKELEKKKEKGGKIIFVQKKERKLVDVIIAGKVTTVDLLELLENPVENSRKIMAAELALP